MEQPFRRGRAEQRRRLRSAARLPEDHHARRIAAERADVVADPLERRDHVHDAADAGRSKFLGSADRREMRIAEARQPMIDRDDHDVAEQRELAAVVHRAVAGAGRPAAAVERHQHGALRVVVDAGCPDVEREAVFAHAAAAHVAVPHDHLRVVRSITRHRLRRDRPVAEAIARSPVHAAGLRGGMKRFLPDVSAPYGMPRKILIPVFAMPRTRPLAVSTSKKSGPLDRAGVCASAIRSPLAPTATNPANPLLITLRRDRSIRCFALMVMAFREDARLVLSPFRMPSSDNALDSLSITTPSRRRRPPASLVDRRDWRPPCLPSRRPSPCRP